MADLEAKEMGSRDPGVEEMYLEPVNDRASDERKIEGEGIDAGDMYRMGKDQQFRVSIGAKHGEEMMCELTRRYSVFFGFQR
jgi:hypothetical protein